MLQDTGLIQSLVYNLHRAVLKREVRRTLSKPVQTLVDSSLLLGPVAWMHPLTLHEFDDARQLLEMLIERARTSRRRWRDGTYCARSKAGPTWPNAAPMS